MDCDRNRGPTEASSPQRFFRDKENAEGDSVPPNYCEALSQTVMQSLAEPG